VGVGGSGSGSGDLFGGPSLDPVASDAGGGSAAAASAGGGGGGDTPLPSSRAAMLERQRQLAATKSMARMSAPSVHGVDGGVGAAATLSPKPSFSRGAPMLSAARFSDGGAFGGSLGGGGDDPAPSARFAAASPGISAGSASSGGSGGAAFGGTSGAGRGGLATGSMSARSPALSSSYAAAGLGVPTAAAAAAASAGFGFVPDGATSARASLSAIAAGGVVSSLSEALRERERRTMEKDVVGGSGGASSLAGVSASALPVAAGGVAGVVSSGYAGVVGGSAAAGAGAGASAGARAGADAAGGKSGDLMPVAPLLVGVGGVSGPSIAFAAASTLDFSDMRRFLTAPVPPSAGVVQCYIERDKSGITNRMYPVYTLFLRDGDRFLLASRKRANNKTSNYLITMDRRDMTRESAAYVGKVRGNFVGTEFLVYDDGVSPDSKEGAGDPRCELAVIEYASNVLGSRGPRKMKAAVPKIGADGHRIAFRATT